MSQLQDDFAKSTADREKQYQDQRLDLFMAHQDKLTEAQKEFASLQKDLQNSDNPDRRVELEARVNETKTQLDAEQAIVNQYASLKEDAEKYRASTDLERLRLKHETESLADKQAFDEKMVALKAQMQEEEDEYKKQTERLKEETVRRFDELLKEYKKGYDALIAESKLKQSELKGIQDQAEATVRAIQAARSAITSAPSGSAAVIPHLAAGGIVTRPTVALIGERGPEAVIPLNRSGAALGGQPVSVSILEGAVLNISSEADESRLARTVAKELAKVLQGNRFGLAAQM
jgi:chromosome segregation ATPase